MRVSFTQVYTKVGVDFPFSWKLQKYLRDQISAVVKSSAKLEAMGAPEELAFYISARSGIQSTDVRGPAVSKRLKTVEFSLFLPFSEAARTEAFPEKPLRELLAGVREVLAVLEIDTTSYDKICPRIVAYVISNKAEFTDYNS